MRTNVRYSARVVIALDEPMAAEGSGQGFAWRSDGALADAEACARRVLEEDIDELSDGTIGEDLQRSRRIIDLLEADFARRLARFNKHCAWLDTGHRSSVSWLRANC